jgi:hypothetical protein
MTYELAMMKVDERSHVDKFAGHGHLPHGEASSIRVLVGNHLMAIGRWIAGTSSVAPAAGSR